MIAAAAPGFNRAQLSERQRPALAHVPAGIDWEAIVPRAWLDYARWYVGQVVFQRFRVHDLTPDDWCPMAAKFCEQFIPKNVLVPLVKALLRAGVLECDGYYRPTTPEREGHCKHYRLGKAYRELPIVAIELRNPDLLKHIEAYYQRERDAVIEPVHVRLREWVERMEVLPIAPYGDPVLDRIRTGDCWFAVCEQGRVHTPATNLARNYRPFVRLDGHELVAVDVSCSQPILLGVTLRSAFALTGAVGGPTTTAVTTAASQRRRAANRHPHQSSAKAEGRAKKKKGKAFCSLLLWHL